MSYLEENQSYMTEVGGYFYTSDKKLVWRGEHGKKTFLSGHCIKEKGMRPFPHSCFAHWPESSGVTGNGVTVRRLGPLRTVLGFLRGVEEALAGPHTHSQKH